MGKIWTSEAQLAEALLRAVSAARARTGQASAVGPAVLCAVRPGPADTPCARTSLLTPSVGDRPQLTA